MIFRFQWVAITESRFAHMAPPLAQDGPVPTIAAIVGPPGREGAPGAPGDSVMTDPGDLTLIFDNRLI